MKRLVDAVRLTGTALDSLDREWVLIGGLAVSALTEPRFTRDVDLAVVVADDRDAEGLIRTLLARGFGVLAQVEHEAAERLATVRLHAPGESAQGVVVDLLFASSGIEAELVASARRELIFSGIEVPLPAVGHLIALKLLSETDRRLKDRQDLLALLAVADDVELSRARRACTLIQERGFDRGRDLVGSLHTWLARSRAT